jgi:hypothetical protein
MDRQKQRRIAHTDASAAQLSLVIGVEGSMKWIAAVALSLLTAGLACGQAQTAVEGQGASGPAAPAVTPAVDSPGPVNLEWAPPALTQLSAEAAVKSSFTLDRTMLGAVSEMMPDSDVDARHAIAKLDGVSVHLMRFGNADMVNPEQVDAVRAGYHLRGWKHVLTASQAGGPIHDRTTDAWLVLDGTHVRGAVVLVETPRSLTLVTLAGNLSPLDLLHLRGHFGIPRLDDDAFKRSQ